jgi:hypothetical protein
MPLLPVRPLLPLLLLPPLPLLLPLPLHFVFKQTDVTNSNTC